MTRAVATLRASPTADAPRVTAAPSPALAATIAIRRGLATRVVRMSPVSYSLPTTRIASTAAGTYPIQAPVRPTFTVSTVHGRGAQSWMSVVAQAVAVAATVRPTTASTHQRDPG